MFAVCRQKFCVSFFFYTFVCIDFINLIFNIAMKKFVLVFSFLFFTSYFSFASVSDYRIDDNAVESLFAQAEEVSILNSVDFNDMPAGIELMTNPEQLEGSDTPIVAFLLCSFLGGLGVHRLYLGTEAIVFIAYLCTGGGFGILTCGDWIMLLIGVINDDISKYVDNPALIMW